MQPQIQQCKYRKDYAMARTGGESVESTRISVMAVDMWYMAEAMTMVVYGSGDDDGGIWQR